MADMEKNIMKTIKECEGRKKKNQEVRAGKPTQSDAMTPERDLTIDCRHHTPFTYMFLLHFTVPSTATQ